MVNFFNVISVFFVYNNFSLNVFFQIFFYNLYFFPRAKMYNINFTPLHQMTIPIGKKKYFKNGIKFKINNTEQIVQDLHIKIIIKTFL